ncbi:MAG: hypothetical protein DME92_09495 [Verrucomicrobia bacterium]|nr:MAG: hypothetical protein DME92_09495 [Verrucomicrobiota bacterium]
MFLDVQRQESPSGSAESIKTGVNERSHLTEIYFCPLGHCRRPLLAIATLTAVCGEYTGGISSTATDFISKPSRYCHA